MHARWWRRRICRCRRIWKRASATRRRLPRSTIRLAGDIGLVGGSIEDATGDPQRPLFDPGLATERIAAAVAAARAVPFRFMLTARAEGFIRGNPDLDDTIRRSAGVRGGRRGCADGAGPARPRSCADRVLVAVEAVQLHGGDQGEVVLGAGTCGGRREADQPCHVTLSCGDDRAVERGARGEGARGRWATSTRRWRRRS